MVHLQEIDIGKGDLNILNLPLQQEEATLGVCPHLTQSPRY